MDFDLLKRLMGRKDEEEMLAQDMPAPVDMYAPEEVSTSSDMLSPDDMYDPQDIPALEDIPIEPSMPPVEPNMSTEPVESYEEKLLKDINQYSQSPADMASKEVMSVEKLPPIVEPKPVSKAKEPAPIVPLKVDEAKKEEAPSKWGNMEDWLPVLEMLNKAYGVDMKAPVIPKKEDKVLQLAGIAYRQKPDGTLEKIKGQDDSLKLLKEQASIDKLLAQARVFNMKADLTPEQWASLKGERDEMAASTRTKFDDGTSELRRWVDFANSDLIDEMKKDIKADKVLIDPITKTRMGPVSEVILDMTKELGITTWGSDAAKEATYQSLRSKLQRLASAYGKNISGVAISDQEFERLRAALPNLKADPKVFLDALHDITKERARDMAQLIRGHEARERIPRGTSGEWEVLDDLVENTDLYENIRTKSNAKINKKIKADNAGKAKTVTQPNGDIVYYDANTNKPIGTKRASDGKLIKFK